MTFQVLLGFLAVFVAAKVGGYMARRLGQPAVLGELLAGMCAGPFVIVHPSIDLLAQIGVLVLLFEVGLESTVGQMMSVGTSSFLVAVLGVIAPFALGWGVGAWFLPDAGGYVHAFLGATLTATSVGITARVLKDLGHHQSGEACVILGAAVIDDVLGLVLLAVVGGTFHKASFLLIGAFATGLVMEKDRYQKFVRLVSGFLVPIFFVVMGMKTDLYAFAQPGVLGLAAALTLAAIVGKQACSLGVLAKGVDKLSVGLGMIPRGEVGLIFANVGMALMIQGRPVIDAATFSAVVIMVIVTTMMTPPLLKWSLARGSKR